MLDFMTSCCTAMSYTFFSFYQIQNVSIMWQLHEIPSYILYWNIMLAILNDSQPCILKGPSFFHR